MEKDKSSLRTLKCQIDIELRIVRRDGSGIGGIKFYGRRKMDLKPLVEDQSVKDRNRMEIGKEYVISLENFYI